MILLALAVNTGYTFFYSWDEMSTDFMDGYTAGHQQAEKSLKTSTEGSQVCRSSRNLYLQKTEKGGAILDSVYNEISGGYVPATIQQLDVRVSNKDSAGTDLLFVLLSLILIPAVIGVFILLINLITSINANTIFTKTNVRRLRWIGFSLITISGLYTIGNYVELEQTRSLVAINGYEITGENIIEFPSLINALIAFLAAEVFALGLKLREEQELTI